ncbi:MAG: hypothetical protein PHO89_10440, partial [Methylacidiphilaceae bacterium]|nr:hypothetical protein [Candidatus Methylacidiphilaceae bacterium]
FENLRVIIIDGYRTVFVLIGAVRSFSHRLEAMQLDQLFKILLFHRDRFGKGEAQPDPRRAIVPEELKAPRDQHFPVLSKYIGPGAPDAPAKGIGIPIPEVVVGNPVGGLELGDDDLRDAAKDLLPILGRNVCRTRRWGEGRFLGTAWQKT